MRFENDWEATAAARRVTIVDQLDDNLDWTTFEQSKIDFGDHVIDVPPGLTHFETSLAVDGWTWNATDGWHTGETPLIVDIIADCNTATGEINWSMECYDPETGYPPLDPYAGFLPPNDEAGETYRGEGQFNYTIMPDPGLPTGMQITNMADIVFDYNPVIPTLEVLNTIDAAAPSSIVTALPEETTDYPFTVEWSGQDDPNGSGIATYDIYLSVDGEPFSIWLDDTTDTSGVLNGQPGSTYAFYSIATDNVGYVEDAPAEADATTTIPVAIPLPPTIGVVTAATVTLVDLGKGNVGSVEHAVFEEITDRWVALDGQLGMTPAWQPADAWTDTLVWCGLQGGMQYLFKSKARSDAMVETELGEAAAVIMSPAGDANGDGEITTADEVLIEDAMGATPGQPTWDPRADLDGDGVVTAADLAIVKVARLDTDFDDDADLIDFARLQVCFTGSDAGPPQFGCGNFDYDNDGDVDADDLPVFIGCLTGPEALIDANCID